MKPPKKESTRAKLQEAIEELHRLYQEDLLPEKNREIAEEFLIACSQRKPN
jgi:hypothetical protein